MTEGELTHRLMQARALTDNRDDMKMARVYIDLALVIVRRVHRG